MSALLSPVALAVTAAPFGATPLARYGIVAALLLVVGGALVAAMILRRNDEVRTAKGASPASPPAPVDETLHSISRIGETVLVYLFRYAADGRLVTHCAATPRLLGDALPAIKADGHRLRDLVHPGDLPTFDAAFAARTGSARAAIEAQYRLRAADGTWRWLHERIRPLASNAAGGAGGTTGGGRESAPGTGAVWESIAVDFTDRRAAADRQQHLLDLQRLATRVLESFVRFDDTQRCIDEMLAMTGETLGLSRVSFVRIDPDAESATVEREWAAPGVGSARERRQVQQLDKTGWWIPQARQGKPSFFRRDETSLGSGESSAGAPRSMHEEVLSMMVVPIQIHGVLRAAIVFEDLTTARRFKREEVATAQTLAFAVVRGLERDENAAERRRVEVLQRELERSELVSQLAGGIAHDFNNVLFAVRGQIQILRHRTTDSETLEAFDRIESAIAGASNMVADILRAHRGDVEPRRPTPLAEALEEGCRLVVRLLPATVEFERELAGVAGSFVASSSRALGQLVLNLALNARDAVAAHGTAKAHIRLTARVVQAPGEPPKAVLYFDDNGPGIPPENRARALKPFYTTKRSVPESGDPSRAGGSGLGLSICQRVAQQAGGRLLLERSPDLGGLRVEVHLPLCVDALTEREDGRARPGDDAVASNDGHAGRSAAQNEEAADDADDAEHRVDAFPGVGCALIVEDDAAVRRILLHALTSHDVEVIERGSADDLEAIVVNGPVTIDLIVMDVDLPGTTGLEAARRLRARGAMTPIVFVTGGTSEFDPLLAPATLLRKPFPIEALAHAAAEVLGTSSRPQAGRRPPDHLQQ